jgi:hypothetical protein
LDEATAKRFRKRFVLSASRKGFREFSEDLAHDALIKWLEGIGKHQTVDQATVDAIRGTFGRPSTLGYLAKRAVARPAGSMGEMANISSNAVDPNSEHDFERIIKSLGTTDRAILVLTYVWGFKEIEVGHCFGITESRVSQRLKGIYQGLSRKLEAEERRQGQGSNGEVPQNSQGETSSTHSLEEILRIETNGLECETAFSLANEKFWSVEVDNGEGYPEWFA